VPWSSVVRPALPGDADDTQSRYIEAAVDGVLIATLHAPNGNPQPGPKFKHKLAWMKRLFAHAAELYVLDAPVVLAGDFNVVPTDADIYPTKSYAKNALLQPEPRALFRRILDQGTMAPVTSQRKATLARPHRGWQAQPAPTNRDRQPLWQAALGSGRGGDSQQAWAPARLPPP
jgi:exonuclease III